VLEYRHVHYHAWLFLKIFKEFFGGTGVLTQGLELARKALYHLSHTPNLSNYVLGR
jgi:hypothetical protein